MIIKGLPISDETGRPFPLRRIENLPLKKRGCFTNKPSSSRCHNLIKLLFVEQPDLFKFPFMELFGFCSIRCGVGIWGKFVVSDRLWLPTGSVPFLTCQERNRKKQPEERRNLFSFGTAYKSALFSPRKKCPLLWTLLQRYALIVFFFYSLLCPFATENRGV